MKDMKPSLAAQPCEPLADIQVAPHTITCNRHNPESRIENSIKIALLNGGFTRFARHRQRAATRPQQHDLSLEDKAAEVQHLPQRFDSATITTPQRTNIPNDALQSTPRQPPGGGIGRGHSLQHNLRCIRLHRKHRKERGPPGSSTFWKCRRCRCCSSSVGVPPSRCRLEWRRLRTRCSHPDIRPGRSRQERPP